MKHQGIFVTTEEPTDFLRTQYLPNVFLLPFHVRVTRNLNGGSALRAVLHNLDLQRVVMEGHLSYLNHVEGWVIIRTNLLEEEDNIYSLGTENPFVV